MNNLILYKIIRNMNVEQNININAELKELNIEIVVSED